MADSLICDQIEARLLDHGPITVMTHGEFRTKAAISGSSKSVKRALGSMIKRGKVIRHRDSPEGCTPEPQPITFKLPHD